MPLAGGARQEALPHARRRTGIRRAKGKPERAQARPVHEGCDRRAEADSGVVGGGAEAAGGDEVTNGSRSDDLSARISRQGRYYGDSALNFHSRNGPRAELPLWATRCGWSEMTATGEAG